MTTLRDLHAACHHRKYRMTCAEYNDLYARANGCCEVCDAPEAETPDRILHTDHNHNLGMWAVRGLLCGRCNTLEGMGRLIGPRAEAYFANAWWIGRRGLVDWPEQPPVGTVVRLGRNRWRRGRDGWRCVHDGVQAAITWGMLTERFAPDELIVLPLVDVDATQRRLIALGSKHRRLLNAQPRDEKAIRHIQRADLADAIRAARGAGFTTREVARWTGCTPDRVKYLWDTDKELMVR